MQRTTGGTLEDKEVVLAAVASDGLALQWAGTDFQPLRLRVPSAGLPGSGTVRQRARWNGYFGSGAPQTVKVAKVFKTF